MTDSLDTVLAAAICDRQLLDHPFYRRWEAGALSHEELRLYAEQYRYFEAMLPLFLEQLARKLPEGFVRESVLKNLADEVATPSHLVLFEQFARFYRASEAPVSLAMTGLIHAYSETLKQGPTAALAGLWSYESQGAAIADSKAVGLATHYDANSESLRFWLAHGTVEKDHARWTLAALDALAPNYDEVKAAAYRIANSWWSFLDERESLAA